MSHSSRTRRRRRSRSKPRNKILLGIGVIIAVLAIAGLSAVGYVVSIANSAPPLDSLKPRSEGNFSIVYARDGKRLGVIQANTLRKEIPSDHIPEVMKDATIAIEDARFYKHKGVDYQGVVRAVVKNIESGKKLQGGSTITQQLVRALYTSDEKSYKRKIIEARLAEEYENKHSKDEILTSYLNDVPYGTYGGQTALGVWAASKIYFNKPVSELTLPQAALLAGLPQAPSEYSPVRDPQSAKARRNLVLAAMAKQNMISQAQAAEAQAAPLGLDLSSYFQNIREGFFFDYVKDLLFQSFPVSEVKRGGLRVYTTIDLGKQEQARGAINGSLAGIGPSSAIVTINPKNGQILTMASSADYGDSKFNLAAQGSRQPGSSFKVMALMAAVSRGINPDTTYYTSKPLNFTDPTYGLISVKTYSNTYAGTISLRKATLLSDNSVYQQLALDLGPDFVDETAHKMGIPERNFDGNKILNGFPAETLGGLKYGVSPLNMADAYATIASGGVWHKATAIRKIKTLDGRVLRGKTLPTNLRPESERRFQDGVTAKVTDVLENNMTAGTGTNAQIGCPAAGKTGTTDEHSDAWFVGFTPRLTTAVWVGYPNANIHMYTEYHGGPVAGATFPSEIWRNYMSLARNGHCEPFPEPKHPLTFQKFYGHYSTESRSSTYGPSGDSGYTYDPSATTTPTDPAGGATPAPTTAPTTTDPGTGTGTDTGGGGAGTGTGGNGNSGGAGYDPSLYTSPDD
ncbi:MAG: penicillin-binding protein [Solirubrobacteraceae bacterium]|nr:penicillin-binding protein [Solirubrobacteraceae bacterium]